MIYLDVETLPREGVPRPAPTPEEPDPFAPPPCHEIACMVGIWWTGKAWDRRVWFADTLTDIACEILGRGPVAGWGIRRFDLPVLLWHAARYRHRALAERVRALMGAPRYKHDAVRDVSDILSGYGAAPHTSLDAACKALGLRGKGETDGTDVERLWVAEGRRDDVVTYCTEDVVHTILVDMITAGAAVEKLTQLWDAAAPWVPELARSSWSVGPSRPRSQPVA